MSLNLEQALEKIKTAKTLFDAQDELKIVAKELSAELKPEIDALLSDEGKAAIKEAAEALHEQLSLLPTLVQGAAMQIEMAKMFISPEMIKQLTDQAKQTALAKTGATQNVENLQTELETVKMYKSLTENVPEDEYVALSKAIYTIIPKGLKAHYNTASGKGKKSTAQQAKEMYSVLKNNSEREILASGLCATPDKVGELFLEGAVQAFSKLDTDKLAAALGKLPTRITADDMSDIAIEFLSASRDVLNALDNDQDIKILENAHTKKLFKSLKSVFAAIEDTCVDAGITLHNAGDIATAMADHRSKALAQLKI